MKLTLTALAGIPLIEKGDSLTQIIIQTIEKEQLKLHDGDVLVLAQKIVSKAEGRMVDLREVIPSAEATDLAYETEKDPRLVEMILQESSSIIRKRPGNIIAEHHSGFICANAGIDHSNVSGSSDWILLLPKDSDASAEQIRKEIGEAKGVKIGVLIIDSHGRAWRNGTVGITIGIAGLPGIVDKRGTVDMFGYELRVTQIGVADELAAGASLMMGQVDEGTPVVHVRGFPYALRDADLEEILREKDRDMFR